MSEQIEKICYELAKKLFPRPARPEPWCDDGWGGFDMVLVEARWREKAAIIKKALENMPRLPEKEALRAQIERLKQDVTTMQIRVQELLNS